MPAKILAVVEDIFFLAKIQQTARQLGITVETVAPDALQTCLAAGRRRRRSGGLKPPLREGDCCIGRGKNGFRHAIDTGRGIPFARTDRSRAGGAYRWMRPGDGKVSLQPTTAGTPSGTFTRGKQHG